MVRSQSRLRSRGKFKAPAPDDPKKAGSGSTTLILSIRVGAALYIAHILREESLARDVFTEGGRGRGWGAGKGQLTGAGGAACGLNLSVEGNTSSWQKNKIAIPLILPPQDTNQEKNY